MHQVAPYPEVLEEIVSTFKYRPGWSITLKDLDRDQGQKDDDGNLTPVETHCVGLTLIINTRGYNSYHHEQGQNYGVSHYMIVPAATYNRESWMNWVLEQCFLVERHEACEFADFDGDHFFAPHHSPGNDPYIVWHHGDDIDRRTSFRGVVKPT